MIITDIDEAEEIISGNNTYDSPRHLPSHFERLVIFNDIMKKYNPDQPLNLFIGYDDESINFGEFPEEGMEEEDLITLGKAHINLNAAVGVFYMWE